MDNFYEKNQDILDAGVSAEKGLQEKYGKVLRMKFTLVPDDETEIEKQLFFKRPSTQSYDRYLKNISRSMMRASKDFILDNITDECEQETKELLEEYPAAAITMAEQLLQNMGLGQNANLKRV